MSDINPPISDIERIERDAWRDLARAAPPPFAQGIGLETAELGRALWFMAAKIPLFQFNWLSGAGLDGDDGACIAEAVRRFRAAGQGKFSVQIAPGPAKDGMESLARAQGLAAHSLAWAKFHRPTRHAPSAKSDLKVREVGLDQKDVFAQTAVAGFGMPKPMAFWLAQIVGRPKWHVFVSFDRDTPAGAGALYVDGDFAWLGIGATIPDMRKRGGQSALLAHRIAAAARLGAHHAVTETGVPQPGQPAPSYGNIQRAGFTVAYVRANWTPPA